jgi:hypothetical protein
MVISYGTFIDGLFVFVIVDFFLVRPISEWINFLASHGVQFFDCCNIKDDRRAALESLPAPFRPHFYLCVASTLEVVHFCANAYQQKKAIELLLQCQVHLARQ